MAELPRPEKNQNGICSICSAHPFVLGAALARARRHDNDVLIESTSNQVDQFGGYTGKTPAMFADFVYQIAGQWNIPRQRVILGGDHLGPNVWRNEPSVPAMDKACDLVAACVEAGYRKIHLDASMHCADDLQKPGQPLGAEIVAERTVHMAAAAEESFSRLKNKQSPPYYIIGSDVPPPGGATDDLSDLHITTAEAVEQTIELTHQAFSTAGLDPAWDRVIAVVVQPGVEFGDQTVAEYDRKKARQLSKQIESHPNFTYEAHSTDYQKKESLRELVEDHFTILKVGPWLTFAFREAVFAMELIEREWLRSIKSVELSNLSQVVETVMLNNPKYWQKHYGGDEHEKAFSRKYSYSDRVRYYWPDKDISRSLNLLIHNLNQNPPPLSLMSQHLPRQYYAIREKRLKNEPLDLIYDKIDEILEIYDYAIGKGRTL